MKNGIERGGEEDEIKSQQEEEEEKTIEVKLEKEEAPEPSREQAPQQLPKKQRWTKKKQELAAKKAMEEQGIKADVPLTALSRRALRDQGLSTKTIEHIRNQAKVLDALKKEEIDAEAERAAMEVEKRKLMLMRERAEVERLKAEVEQYRSLEPPPKKVRVEEHVPQHHHQPVVMPPAPSYRQAPPSMSRPAVRKSNDIDPRDLFC